MDSVLFYYYQILNQDIPYDFQKDDTVSINCFSLISRTSWTNEPIFSSVSYIHRWNPRKPAQIERCIPCSIQSCPTTTIQKNPSPELQSYFIKKHLYICTFVYAQLYQKKHLWYLLMWEEEFLKLETKMLTRSRL